jgi:hypothetical protein
VANRENPSIVPRRPPRASLEPRPTSDVQSSCPKNDGLTESADREIDKAKKIVRQQKRKVKNTKDKLRNAKKTLKNLERGVEAMEEHREVVEEADRAA